MEQLGRYRIVKPLGTGAMGAVYLARDELLGRDVAVKTIRALDVTGVAADAFRQRFENEARAVAALSHPNVVRVFDMGIEGDTPFLVMELALGRSLKERLQAESRLTCAEARVLGVQMARALEAAHARGILHRDLKPANILEAEPGTWKLADFGVAHVPDSSMTITGQFVGSPAYSAPEALDRGAFSPASDVYALGATLYEALAGEPPYGRRGLLSVAALAAKSDPEPVASRRPDVPADLAALLGRALARDAAARPSAGDLAVGLAAADAPAVAAPAVVAAAFWTRGRVLLLAGAMGVFALLAGLAIGAGTSGRRDPEPSPAGPPPGVPVPGAVPEEDPRAADHLNRWNRIQEKLTDGKGRDVAKDLEKLLEDYPDDAEAQALLNQLRAHGQGGRRHGKGRDKN